MNDVEAAKIIIGCLDLTSLESKDTEAKIERLCEKAKANKVAAVCTHAKFIPLTKNLLKNSDVKIATVVNFPEGKADFQKTKAEIKKVLKLGAEEIDAVFPYKEFLKGNLEPCETFFKMVTDECKKTTSKIILETGELKKASLIYEASQLCIKHGVGFIKTSTTKTPVAATPEAANAILETIASSKAHTGFKASGSIKTIDDAKKYLTLAQAIMGTKWVKPQNFRIGASALLDNLLQVIERGY